MSRFSRGLLLACCVGSLLIFLALPSRPQSTDDDDQDANTTAAEIREHYTKHEYRIPMRDGTKLFTAVYIPKDTSQSYPFLIDRTPYSVSPYGADHYPKRLALLPFSFATDSSSSSRTFAVATCPKAHSSKSLPTRTKKAR